MIKSFFDGAAGAEEKKRASNGSDWGREADLANIFYYFYYFLLF